MESISFDTLLYAVKTIIIILIAIFTTTATEKNRKNIIRLWLRKGKQNEEHLLMLDGSIKTSVEIAKHYDIKELIAGAVKTLLILYAIYVISQALAVSHSYVFMLIHLIASSVLLIKRFRKHISYKEKVLKHYMCRATER